MGTTHLRLPAALGFAMTAYYGGRAECRLRRVIAPVRYLDYRSMYTTVCSLLKLWQLVIAEQVEVVDATAEVQGLLDTIDTARLFDPETWPALVGLVQFVPDGRVLPERSRHDATASWQIGVNRVRAQEPIWYTIPDAVASFLLGGPPVWVVRALRFVPRGTRASLRPLRLRGEVPVDPAAQDFFRVVIEERVRSAQRPDLGADERGRLDRFLKVFANSVAYGIYGEMNREEVAKDAGIRGLLHGLEEEPVEIPVPAPERPGEYFFVPLAALIAGAARLMLALLEQQVRRAGGHYVFCDTDSMAIVASEWGGQVRYADERGTTHELNALSWDTVSQIRQRFARLNPYDPETVPGSILKLEDANLDEHGREVELFAYSISAKRYALFRLNAAGEPVLVKWSEHGLGHLLNPLDPDSEDRDWIRGVWELLVRQALGLPVQPPAWLDRPAIGRLTVSSPELLRPFAALNRGRPYAEQVKPGNFLLTAQLAPFGAPSGVDPARFQLIAPWESDPRKWLRIRWTDRYGGGSYPITTTGATGGPGIARVRTYGEVLEEYASHPEAKSAAPDGSVCGRLTIGELQRRTIEVGRIVYVGKESNRIEEVDAGVLHDEAEYLNVYPDPRRDPWLTEVLPTLRRVPTAELMKTLAVGRSTAKRWKAGKARPRPRDAAKVHALLRQADATSTGPVRSAEFERRARRTSPPSLPARARRARR